MINKPKQSQMYKDDSGELWVPHDWVAMQTSTPSTNGWTEFVVEKLRGESRTFRGHTWWPMRKVMAVFREGVFD
jgi:hypothetical protein